MSLLDRVRTTRTTDASSRDPALWAPSIGSGMLAAAGSWLVLVLPALLVWVATAHTTVGWGDAVAIASAGWFLSHGSALAVGPASISVVPLGLWAIALVVTSRALGRLLDRTEAAAKGTTWPRLVQVRHLPGFALGYGALGAAAWLLTLAGPARPGPVGMVTVLAMPVLAALVCLVRRHITGRESPLVGDWLDRLPRWATRCIAPGLWGSALLLGLGTALVAVMLIARLSTVTGLYAALGAGVVGGLVLTLGQLVLLPNLAIWALAWLAGPGFSVSDGSAITVAGAHPGLMPMIPILGVLPTEGSWPRWLGLVLLLPVAAGALVAWRACASVARLSSWRTKLTVSAAGVAVSVAPVAVLAVLGTGAAGVERLRQVGPNPLALTAALLAELLLGALVYVAADQVRQRRR